MNIATTISQIRKDNKMPKHSFHFYATTIDSQIPGEDVRMRVIGPEYDSGLYLSNSYDVDSEGNIVRGFYQNGIRLLMMN